MAEQVTNPTVDPAMAYMDAIINSGGHVVEPSSPELEAANKAAEAALSDGQSVPVEPASKPAKVEPTHEPAPEPEAKVEDEAKVETTPKDDDIPVIDLERAPKPGRPPRDYSGLDEQETELFKKMGSESFRVLKPIYDEYKKNGKKFAQTEAKPEAVRPLNYYETDDGVVLTPEFKELSTGLDNFKKQVNFWTQQLERIKTGEKYQDVVMGQDGRPQFVEKEPSVKNEADIIAKLSQASQYANQYEIGLTNLVQGFATHRTNTLKALKEIEDRFFPHYSKVDDKHEIHAFVGKVAKTLPSMFQANPLIPMIGKAYATILELNKRLSEMEKASGISNDDYDDAPTAKPNPTVRSMSSGGAAKQTVSKEVAEAEAALNHINKLLERD